MRWWLRVARTKKTFRGGETDAGFVAFSLNSGTSEHDRSHSLRRSNRSDRRRDLQLSKTHVRPKHAPERRCRLEHLSGPHSCTPRQYPWVPLQSFGPDYGSHARKQDGKTVGINKRPTDLLER